MVQEINFLLFGALGGLIRNFIGYIKAKLKHREAFSSTKFIVTIVWGAIMGAVLSYYQTSRMMYFQPLEIVLLVFAGIVILDEVFQAIFLRSKDSINTAAKTTQG